MHIDIEYANCIRGVNLTDIIMELINNDSVRSTYSTSKISMKNLTDSQIEHVEEHDLLLFVKGPWCALSVQPPKALVK